MSDRIEIEDLGGLSDMPPDDPRRKKLESQPSARARMRAYHEFMSPGELPGVARLAEAEDRLREVLEREIGVSIPSAPLPRPTATARARHETGRGLLEWLGAPRLRPVFAAVALAVVIGGVWILAQPRREGVDTLRGTAPQPAPGAWAAQAAAETLADGTLRLRWSAAPEADRYAVVFLASDLTEISRMADLTATNLELHRGTLPEGLVPGSAVLWRVVAYQGADEVGRSPTSPVTIP